MAETFVPARAGIGKDQRSLSLLLRGIDFRVAGLTLAQGVLYLLVLLFSIATVYHRPVFALAWIIITATIGSFATLGPVTLTLPQVVLIGCIAGLILHLRLRRFHFGRDTKPFVVMQGLIIAAMSLSAVHAEFQAPAAIELWKALQYFFTFLAAFIAFRLDPNERIPRRALALTTLVVCALAALQIFSGNINTEYLGGHDLVRLSGPLDGPNQFGAFLGLSIPILGAYGLSSRRPYLELAAAVVGVLALIMTFSRGSIIGFLVSATVVLVLRFRAQWKPITLWTTATVFALVLGIAAFQFAGFRSVPDRGMFAEDTHAFNGGLGSRQQLWHDADLLWRTSPWLGVGPGNFEPRIAEVDNSGVRTHANSAYFQALVETGVVGLLLFLGITAFPIRRFAAATSDPLVLGILAAAIGLAFHQIVDVLTFYPKVGILWWAILGLGFAAVARRDTDGASTSST